MGCGKPDTCLVLEPHNRHDTKAAAVQVSGHTVAYLRLYPASSASSASGVYQRSWTVSHSQ